MAPSLVLTFDLLQNELAHFKNPFRRLYAWCNAFRGRARRGFRNPGRDAQNTSSGVVMMNHVGISVPNIAEAVTYYTQKMGYREAFRVNDDKGQPRLVYMQISKNTFLDPTSPTPMWAALSWSKSLRSPCTTRLFRAGSRSSIGKEDRDVGL